MDLDEAQRRAGILFRERIKDADRWDVGETRGGTFTTRRGKSDGCFITFNRRPDPGEEKDWRTTLGIGVFVDGSSGAAEMLR